MDNRSQKHVVITIKESSIQREEKWLQRHALPLQAEGDRVEKIHKFISEHVFSEHADMFRKSVINYLKIVKVRKIH